MDKQTLIERLMGTFLDELDEHVRALNRDLLALEKDGGEARAELVTTLFRTVHSLKGAARSVSLTAIESACHRCEGMLAAVRDGARPLSPALVELLFATADALKDAGERLRARRGLAGAPIEGMLSRLDTATATADSPQPVARTGRTMPAPASLVPPPAPPPASDGVVRIPAERLDRMVAWSGELLVARRRAESRKDDVAALREQVVELWRDLSRLERPLGESLAGHGPPAGGGRRRVPHRSLLAFERARDRLKRLERGFEALESGMAADHHALDVAATTLEGEVRRARMLPFGIACEGLDRLVRDVGKAADKDVELVIEGADVEVDRAIIEALRDPLGHLVRNAVDHGIEPAAERTRRGKPARGRVTVRAALLGDGVELRVADDGRGLDLRAIRAEAHRRKLPVPDDEQEAAKLIFAAGLSTAQRITELSGRGVGLDVVRHKVESLHGAVTFSFEAGAGTCFALSLPLTLTTIRALLVGVREQVYALPTASVRRLVRIRPDQLGSAQGREMLLLGGRPVPVVYLGDALDVGGSHGSGKLSIVVVAAGARQAAVVVDELVAEQECVVKSLGERLRRVRHVAGATILATGRLALILSPSELVDTVLARAPETRLAVAEPRVASKRRLLVADDSTTTRALEKSILETAGYEVITAPDGAEAWRLLQERGADLVVADVEMPRMDGFALCEAVRASKRFRDLPFILVTALESDRHKVRGLEAGADAYLPKSTFDQRQLLEAVARLL